MVRALQPTRLVAAIGVLALGACSRETSVLVPAGPIAEANRTILINSLLIMLAIVVPTMIATMAFAWWFREGNPRARYRPEFVFSGRIELIVWSIPILTILFLSGLIWIGSHRLEPSRPLSDDAHLEVQVVALDWKWLFIYPGENVASVNELVLPVGAPSRFYITSGSVMNVFFVPALGSQMYAMNGMRTTLHLRADEPGVYYGRSAHFSGDGYPRMSFRVRAVPEAEYAAWVDAARRAPRPLDRAAYTALAEQSVDVPAHQYAGVEPQIFERIVSQDIPPARGPDEGRGGSVDVHPVGTKK